MMKVNWDQRFLDLAGFISTWSKDKSRGVGGVIVNDDKRVISFGYNGFPSGVDDEVDARHERPAKYDWTVHAEENAIANAARLGISTMNGTIYLNLFPCARCAGLIVNAGIKRVVVSKEPNYNDEKYGHEFRISREKLIEADVQIDIVKLTNIFKIDIGDIPPDKVVEYIKNVTATFKNSNANEVVVVPSEPHIHYDESEFDNDLESK